MPSVFVLPSATNLSLAGSYSSGAVPTGGEDLFIVEGNQNITAGLSALSAVTLNRFVMAGTFGGRAGSAGAPLVIGGVTVDALIDLSGWDMYVNLGTCAWASLRETYNGSLTLTGGTVADLVTRAGKANLLAAAIVTRLNNVGAEVFAQACATDFTRVVNQSGRLRSQRNADNLWCTGGDTEWELDATIDADLVIAGGSHNHGSGGSIDSLYGIAGEFRTRGLHKAIAVTTRIDRYKGFRWFPKDGAGSVSIASATKNDYGYDASDSSGAGVKG